MDMGNESDAPTGVGARPIAQPSSTVTYKAADLANGHATIRLIEYQYEVYAVGKCSEGGQTEKSNILRTQSIAQPFFKAHNGVTIRCPLAAVGATGTIDGITYTKRDRAGLLALKATLNEPELVTSCTSGVTDMSELFAVRDPARLLSLVASL